MGKNKVVWFVGVGLVLAACGGSSKVPKKGTETCTAGERTCDGLDVLLCDDDGKTQTVDETCLLACESGACLDGGTGGGNGTGGSMTGFGGTSVGGVCEPDTQSCGTDGIYGCDATGSSSSLIEACNIGTFCVLDDSGDPSCQALACNPNGPMCDGDVATVCKADGSGPLPGGKSCADINQSCSQGVCRDFSCDPGQKVCKGGDVYLCNPDGASAALLADCNAAQVCDGTVAACRSKVCEVGSVGCDGTKVVSCNDFGSEWLPPSQDCAMSGAACVSGSCKEKTCTPNTKFCQNNDVYSCDINGVSSTIYQTCTQSYYHCETYGMGTAYCQPNTCTSGQPVCDGNILKTCTADGKLPATGTDCTTDGKYCDPFSLKCQTKLCEPNTTYCKNGDIYYCNDFNNEYQQQQCLSDTVCKKSGDIVSCVPLLCQPSETGCVGNKIGTCAEDGGSLATTSQDCAATTTVCTTAGICAATAVDTLGLSEDATTASAGTVIGDAIEVHSARKVTSIEANLVLASARELRWVIYEQSGFNWIARVDQVVPNQSGNGYVSSGPLNYTLKANKRYLFAVAVSGGNFITYYDTAPYDTKTSFGSIVGSVNNGYSANLPADYYSDVLYQMRITTVLP